MSSVSFSARHAYGLELSVQVLPQDRALSSVSFSARHAYGLELSVQVLPQDTALSSVSFSAGHAYGLELSVQGHSAGHNIELSVLLCRTCLWP